MKLAIVSVAAALAACGDNLGATDAMHRDTGGEGVGPPPPALGAQLDRAGRPLIPLALVGLVESDAAAMIKRDAYGQAADPAAWATASLGGRTIEAELQANLPFLDVLDRGNVSIPGTPGCGNQLLFNGNPTGGNPPTATSYQSLSRFLADDMLYVDTSKATCDQYLALEREAATGGGTVHTQCGGRTPSHDVIDTTYSMLFAGLAGFTTVSEQPRINDGVPVHVDLPTGFPFFGPPH